MAHLAAPLISYPSADVQVKIAGGLKYIDPVIKWSVLPSEVRLVRHIIMIKQVSVAAHEADSRSLVRESKAVSLYGSFRLAVNGQAY